MIVLTGVRIKSLTLKRPLVFVTSHREIQVMYGLTSRSHAVAVKFKLTCVTGYESYKLNYIIFLKYG